MLKLNFTIVILIICGFITQAAVIRQSDEGKQSLEATTVSIDDVKSTLEPEMTTAKGNDFDDTTNTTTKKFGALSRDEEATILIVDQTLLDPAPSELIQEKTEIVQIEKLGKLLLLSTPKISEKPKQPEENIDESDEAEEIVENVTQNIIETTTIDSKYEETTTNLSTEENTSEQAVDTQTIRKDGIEANNNSDNKPESDEIKLERIEFSPPVNMANTIEITKLYPITDAPYDSNNKSQTETKKCAILSEEAVNSNFRSVILKESEADYILVGSDVLEGSYTDIDSELHLQPIVQSIEIVPSILDGNLLNYVKSL